MAFDEDELLAGALGSVGAVVGGRAGAEAAARRLRKNVLELDLALSIKADAATERARRVLAGLGRLLDVGNAREEPGSQVVGIVGAGFGNLNPAVVTVTVQATDSGSRLHIRGAAKEGLIKQRAGEKAANRVAAAITATPS